MNVTTSNLLFRVLLAALGAACLLGVGHAASMLALHVPLDPNEGWNAYFAQMAIRTGSPYPNPGSLLINNYPPLSFYLMGELGRLFGDAIVAGRIVSLLALAIVSIGIAVSAMQTGCSKEQSAFGALLFVAALLLTSDYVGMNDPQLLGHAIAIWGLIIVLCTPRTSRDMVISALLLTIAFFIKHNLVLLPVAISTWLILTDRRRATTFVASGIIFFLIGIGLFRDAFGTSFFHQINSARVFSIGNIRIAAASWLPWAGIPLCGVLLLFWIGRRDRYAIFTVIYVATATIGGFVFSGGAGVDTNAFFDADIALALAACVLLNRLENMTWATIAAALYLIPLMAMAHSAENDWTMKDYWLHPQAADMRTTSQEIALLRSAPEPVLCEMLSLCYWAGKSAQVDVFNMDQRFRTGAQSDKEFVRLIEQKLYSIIQLETLTPFPLTTDVEKAILRNYKIVRTDGERAFLAPR